ncbi:S-layer homology domain-containing protein [Paenibacillus spongiae]|uniref:S-layer homology domain-containing protein n=1 Tax=Paenibacillus spongiae TaxID=2909671 RepID=A0ABY5SAF3_9BACL|nr:S-layer homology domain-containing protein [Paenibacillus spongiae]UVI30488.1 S-layer homology domain-containing protein [Paenibacillus spongiae]
MSVMRKGTSRFFASFIALIILLSSFNGLAFADAGSGTAAEAQSKPIMSLDYSGSNSKSFTVSDDSGAAVDIALDQNLASMQEMVNQINSRLAGTHITAAVTSPNSFKLTSSVIGRYSSITISGPNAADFFANTQYRGTATDAESVAETKASLTPFFDSDDSIGWVTGSMTLPTADSINGTSISWTSSNTGIITNTGSVNRPAVNTKVTLTAEITKGLALATQTFEVTVIGTTPQVVLTDAESVANTKAEITPIYATDESQGYVKRNLLLRLFDEVNGTSISWSSSHTSIVTNSGAVARPLSTVTVTLTATITKGSVTDTVSFDVSVIGTVSELLLNEKAGLHPVYASGDWESSVTRNLQLPSISNGIAINWNSSDAAYLANDGTVTRPNFSDGPANVDLTATLTLSGVSETKTFHITVVPKDETDLEAVTYDKDHLAVGYAAGDSASRVMGSLTLPVSGAHGSVIAWSSSNTAVISNTGVVNRPSAADANVMLTAAVTKGGEEAAATFMLTVKRVEPVNIPGGFIAPPTPPAPPAFAMTSATQSLIESSGSGVIVAAVETSTNRAGAAVTKVNEAELLKQVSHTEARVVVVPVESSNGKAVVSLTPGLLAALKQKDERSKVVFQMNGVTYELPAALADTSAVAKALGLSDSEAKDAEIHVSIEALPASAVQDQVAEAGGTLAASAASFSIAIVTPGKTYDFNDFRGHYINRSFELNHSVDSANAAGVVIHSDGSVSPVPAIFTAAAGKPVAIIKADHNSVYTVIEHTSSLSDIGTSWAKDKIKILANKKIIHGYEGGTFKPSGVVTRAEFAAILAKGLGLSDDASAITFSDVTMEAWYAGAVGAMSSRGFINGYADGSFKADQTITRQEEAIILGRVLAYLNVETDASLSILDSFHDRASIAKSAESHIAALVGLKIMNGSDQGNLNPQGYATRAETAALIYKLLSLVKFLN